MRALMPPTIKSSGWEDPMGLINSCKIAQNLFAQNCCGKKYGYLSVQERRALIDVNGEVAAGTHPIHPDHFSHSSPKAIKFYIYNEEYK